MGSISATRSELLIRRERIRLAEQGRDLLQDKRSALVEEFRRLGRDVLSARARLDDIAGQARLALADATAAEGPEPVRSAGLSARRDLQVRVHTRTVAGVGVVELEAEPAVRTPGARGLAVIATGPHVDTVADRFETLVARLLDIAAVELSLRRLAAEIARTTRQVNALEHVVLPELGRERRSIAIVLEQRELEDRVRLRRARARAVARADRRRCIENRSGAVA